MRIRYIVSLGAASLILATMVARAEDTPKPKVPEVKADAQAQKDAENRIKAVKKEAGVTNAVQKDADKQMRKAEKQSEKMQKQQMKKAEEMQKEAGKGSEKGQAMRKEHSKKWWKFGGEKSPEPVK